MREWIESYFLVIVVAVSAVLVIGISGYEVVVFAGIVASPSVTVQAVLAALFVPSAGVLVLAAVVLLLFAHIVKMGFEAFHRYTRSWGGGS